MRACIGLSVGTGCYWSLRLEGLPGGAGGAAGGDTAPALQLWESPERGQSLGEVRLTADSLVYKTSLSEQSLLLVTPYLALHLEVDSADGATSLANDSDPANASSSAHAADDGAQSEHSERVAFADAIQKAIRGWCTGVHGFPHLPEQVQRHVLKLSRDADARVQLLSWQSPKQSLGFACKEVLNEGVAIVTAVKPPASHEEAQSRDSEWAADIAVIVEQCGVTTAAATAALRGAGGDIADAIVALSGAGTGSHALQEPYLKLHVGSTLCSINGVSVAAPAHAAPSYGEQLAQIRELHAKATPAAPLRLGFRSPPRFDGMLRRRTGRTMTGWAWAKCAVRLRGGQLILGGKIGVPDGSDDGTGEDVGLFDLEGACLRVSSAAERRKTSFIFTLTSGMGEVVFAAPDEAQLVGWCAVLCHAIALVNGGGYLQHLDAHAVTGVPYQEPALAPPSPRPSGLQLSISKLRLDNPFRFFSSSPSAGAGTPAPSFSPRPTSPAEQSPPRPPRSLSVPDSRLATIAGEGEGEGAAEAEVHVTVASL